MIDIVLKCRDRAWDVAVPVRKWADMFASDHRVIIWDDTAKKLMRDQFPDLLVVTKKDVPESEILSMIVSSDIAETWRPAAFAHVATWYVAHSDLFWNIDADDMLMASPISQKVIAEIESYMTEHPKTLAMSWDMYWTYHHAYRAVHPHHWSFGLVIARNDNAMLAEAMRRRNPAPCTWSNNIDYQFEVAKSDVEIRTMVFPNTLLHGGVDNVFDGSSVIKNVTDTGERLIAMPPMPDVVVFGVK